MSQISTSAPLENQRRQESPMDAFERTLANERLFELRVRLAELTNEEKKRLVDLYGNTIQKGALGRQGQIDLFLGFILEPNLINGTKAASFELGRPMGAVVVLIDLIKKWINQIKGE